ncbi:MAG TPA: hypothetical protein VK766_01660 [Cytophagaceae bacterium]|jgi:hypothetical protein|nr:hypothetical protein [Cytophagaceae bacterium]
MIKAKIPKLSQLTLENFGVYYLKSIQKDNKHNLPLAITDKELVWRVRWLTARGVVLSALIGFASAFVSVYTDLYFADENIWLHYFMLGLNTLIATGIEFYVLFIIALHTVNAIADLTNTKYSNEQFTEDGPFNIINILARSAMEIPDPPIKVLDIDPFKRISRSKLVIAGFVYKLKIFLSNIMVRLILQRLAGKTFIRFSIIPFVSVPITGIWNAIILYKVSRESRLRIFGNLLASDISKNMFNDVLLTRLSPLARIGCLRAIANAVVLTQNYHPNMIILLMRFKELLGIEEPDNYDDWGLFLQTLEAVNDEERYTILDILTIAAAFDGKISKLERKHLKEAYKEYSDIYFERLEKLTLMLTRGNLQEAIKLCEIDGKPG